METVDILEKLVDMICDDLFLVFGYSTELALASRIIT